MPYYTTKFCSECGHETTHHDGVCWQAGLHELFKQCRPAYEAAKEDKNRKAGRPPYDWENRASKKTLKYYNQLNKVQQEYDLLQDLADEYLTRLYKLQDKFAKNAWEDKDRENGTSGGKAKMERLDTGPAECPAGQR